MRAPGIVAIALACTALTLLAACSGSGSRPSETPAASGANIVPTGPRADALLVIAGPASTKSVLSEALSEATVKKYFLTSLSMDPASFDGLTFADETIWGTVLTAPSAQADAFNAAYQDAYGHPASDTPGTAAAYDSVYVIALAAVAADSADPAAIRDNVSVVANSPGDIANYGTDGFTSSLNAIADGRDINYIGASGQVDVDASGELAKTSVQTWRVLNGAIAPIETRDIDVAAEAGAQLPAGSPPPQGPLPSVSLTIGMIVSDDAAGTALSLAAQLAVKEINAAGGVFGKDVTLSVQKISGAGKALDAVNNLIGDKAGAIIGPAAEDAVAAALPSAETAKTAVLALTNDAAMSSLPDENNVLFRMVPSQALQMPVLANLYLESNPTPAPAPSESPVASAAAASGSVCVVYQTGPAQEQMAKAFAEAMTFKKATVRASIAFDPASADYKSLLGSCIGS